MTATAASPRRAWLQALAIAGLTLLVYVPAMRSGFIWDDDTFLTANPLIKASDGLRRIWASTEPPDYFPLTSTMLWVEWRLWGEHAAGYHVVNVVLHALSCILLWRVLLRLRVPGAWLAGLIFAVHPVNVESVAWITERKNTLPMVFYLLALLLYLRADEDELPAPRARLTRAASLAAFLLALLAKTSVVILPPVLLLCAWWRRGRVTWLDLRRSAPYFALSAILGLVTAWFQGHRAIANDIVRDDGFASRLAIAGKAVWFYLYKAVAPIDLAFVYPRWSTGDVSWSASVPLVLLVLCFAVLWRVRRGRARPLLFGLSYFVLGLLPVLGFLDIYFMRYSLVADHWQYTALPGIAAVAAAGVTTLGTRLGPVGAGLAAGALVAGLGALTWRQQAPYRNSDTLWADTLAKNPTAWIAHNNFGLSLAQQGRLPEAIGHFEQALRFNPLFENAHNNLGTAKMKVGQVEDGIAHLREALRIDPSYAEAHGNLGNALMVAGQQEEAVAHFEQAVRLLPDDADAQYNVGLALSVTGRPAEAIGHFQRAIALRPDLADARSRLGIALAQLGRFPEAIAVLREELAARPNDPVTQHELGAVLEDAGDAAGAIAAWEAALKIEPDFTPALNSLAWVLATTADARLADAARAVKLAERAGQLTRRPKASFVQTLAAAYAAAGRFDEAVSAAEQALALAVAAKQESRAADISAQLELYRAGRAYAQAPGTPGADSAGR